MTIETAEDLAGLKRIGNIVARAVEAMITGLEPGMSTAELDTIGGRVLQRNGAQSAPQSRYGFPGINCISVNEEAVHGIPGLRVLAPGDLVKIDVTAELDGYIADAAVTIPLPPTNAVGVALRACAEASFWRAARVATAGAPLNHVGREIEREVERCGFRVLPDLHSHGVGRAIHEEPTIPQYYEPRLRGRLREGMVVTIETIISAGDHRVEQRADGWTIATRDGSLSAHFEHSMVVTRGQPILLTALS